MSVAPRTPVLVGTAQLQQREDDLAAAKEPLDLMQGAVDAALEDAGAPALGARADAVRVVRGRWKYDDPARAIAQHLGVPQAETGSTPYGGNIVQACVNQAAEEIRDGRRDVVVLTGAETGRSLARARKQGTRIEYRDAPGTPDRELFSDKPMVADPEMARRIVQPVMVYPMFENALRHARGETIADHIARVSELWAGFSQVASKNPDAWIREPWTAEAIRTPTATNRMVGFPYPKLMNSNDSVDMAAALVLCSAEAAERAGVPRDKWVFPWVGTEGHDTLSISHRHDLHSSPAIRIAGGRALELAELSVEDLDHVDLYSCFPVAVQVSATELGLSMKRPLTVTGGLTFGGGPLNNYVMHSIARMAGVLRESPGKRGLVTANGGFLTKHAFGVYSTEPPARAFVREDLQARIDEEPRRDAVVDAEGEALLETYTVMYDADGPASGHGALLLPDGRRTWANHGDRDLARAMTEEEFCHRPARLDGAGGFTVTG